MGMTPKGGLPGAARTSPDIEISGAVLMALTMGMRLGEKTASARLRTVAAGRAKNPDFPTFPATRVRSSSVAMQSHCNRNTPLYPPSKAGTPLYPRLIGDPKKRTPPRPPPEFKKFHPRNVPDRG